MPLDWSLLSTPDFASSALGGYQAGAALGKQKRLDAALQGADLTKPETLMSVLQADPATGATLLTAASEMAKAQHETAGRAALGNYVSALVGGGALGGASPSAAPTPAAMGQTAGAAAAAGALTAPQDAPVDPNAIVVTAHRDAPDPLTAARTALIQSDPKAFLDIQDKVASMNKAQREQLDAANSTFGGAIEAARAMPYEQRRAYIASQRDALISHGVPAQQIDAFDPTDTNIVGIENQVLGVKGILERQDKDRSFALDQQKADETARHNSADEGLGEGRLAVERTNSGISAGHLALDRAKGAREAAVGGQGGGGIQSRRLPNGVVAYRNPANGKWYDNPGFR